MTNRIDDASPQVYTRIGGIFYLLIILAGTLGQLVLRGDLIVSGDAVATANNILASQWRWRRRMGIANDIMMHVLDVPLMLIFYVLLKPVNKNLALLAVLFNLVQTAVLVANELSLLMPLFLLGNASYLKALEPKQLDALVYLFVKLYDYGLGVGLIFFGFECLVVGYLIFRSIYLPKFLGILMQIAGLSYLANSFVLLLSRRLTSPVILLPAFVGEMSLCLWLLIKGVNVQEWNKRASEAFMTP